MRARCTALLLSTLAACGPGAASPDGTSDQPPPAATPSAGTGVAAPSAPMQTSTGGTQTANPVSTPQGSPDGVTMTGTAPNAVPPADTAAGSGSILPCNVNKVMVNSCQNCHGATPIGGAPMALVTFADLHKP